MKLIQQTIRETLKNINGFIDFSSKKKKKNNFKSFVGKEQLKRPF